MKPTSLKLEYASKRRDAPSAARILLAGARGWAVAPLIAVVSAPVGFWITRHHLFVLIGALAVLSGLAAMLAVPALVVAARWLGRRGPERMDAFDANASTSLIVTLVAPVVEFACFMGLAALF